MKTLFKLACSVLLFASLGRPAFGQGITAFTFQGRLFDSGSAANGNYDLRFSLYAAGTGGSALTSFVTNGPVAVSNGLFTVMVDFGPGIFTGANYWMQIDASSNSAPVVYVPMSPRQQITPTPYAITAFNLAGVAENNTVPASLYAAVGGGAGNDATAYYATVSGGNSNSATYLYTTVGGGVDNEATGNSATVAGGFFNQANGYFSFVGGGANNLATNSYATVVGGSQNHAYGPGSFVGGGGFDGANLYGNTAGGEASTVSGGLSNNAVGNYSTVGGGIANSAGPASTVGGGNGNTAVEFSATVAGGAGNVAGGAAFVGGGAGNNASGAYAVVGGGAVNSATNIYATVGGGISNSASGLGAFVGGGGYDGFPTRGNTASGAYSFVGGGSFNTASGPFSFVGGGYLNPASGSFSFVGGGYNNTASNGYSFVGGGENNTAAGQYSTVPGGYQNSAGSEGSFAAGEFATAGDSDSFVWGDGTRVATSQGANSFAVLATGGTYFFSGPSGAYLAPNATTWTGICDRNAKKNFQPVDTVGVLEKLATIPIQRWNYKWEKDSDVPNIGPMAQDFKPAFYPGRDDKGISTLEFDGVELAAIQGLNQKLEVRSQRAEGRIQKLEGENAELKRELAEVKSAQQQAVVDWEARFDALQKAVARATIKSAGTLAASSAKVEEQ